jgi:hypothetical protein
MESKNNLNGRTMHIDVSRRFYQEGDSAIAFKITPSQKHKGIIISNKLKKELRRDLKTDENYPKLCAIYIYYLIKEDFDLFDNLIICDDEIYAEVKKYLDSLFEKNKIYINKFITSLHKFREMLGNPKIRSYADNIANIYRKKAPKPPRRQQKGIPLNLVEVNYQKVKEKWETLK